jgi:hypothetical protein
MSSTKKLWLYAVGFSYASLLAMLARTFLDYQYVYQGLGLNAVTSGLATLVNLAIFGSWIYTLYAAASRFSHGAMFANLFFNALVLIFGASTVITLCPSPCPTGWPVGEIIIWSNILIGIPAMVLAALAALRSTKDQELNTAARAQL